MFLEEVLPELRHSFQVAVPNAMWFQHDWTLSHFRNNERNYINDTFDCRFIGGSVVWPAC